MLFIATELRPPWAEGIITSCSGLRRPMAMRMASSTISLANMGLLKKAASGVLAIFPCSRTTHVRSARKTSVSPCGMNQAMRGLAGRTFLNRPQPLKGHLILGKFAHEYFHYSTIPIRFSHHPASESGEIHTPLLHLPPARDPLRRKYLENGNDPNWETFWKFWGKAGSRRVLEPEGIGYMVSLISRKGETLLGSYSR